MNIIRLHPGPHHDDCLKFQLSHTLCYLIKPEQTETNISIKSGLRKDYTLLFLIVILSVQFIYAEELRKESLLCIIK